VDTSLPPLLSRDTPLWRQLRSEGLYHPSSGYPRLEPEQQREKDDLVFWSDRVKNEFVNGARGGARIPAGLLWLSLAQAAGWWGITRPSSVCRSSS